MRLSFPHVNLMCPSSSLSSSCLMSNLLQEAVPSLSALLGLQRERCRKFTVLQLMWVWHRSVVTQLHRRSFGPSWMTLQQNHACYVQCSGADHKQFGLHDWVGWGGAGETLTFEFVSILGCFYFHSCITQIQCQKGISGISKPFTYGTTPHWAPYRSLRWGVHDGGWFITSDYHPEVQSHLSPTIKFKKVYLVQGLMTQKV